MSRLIFLLTALLAATAACIPAQTPNNLRRTPNALFSVTDGRYHGAAFSVRAPEGWRVISSAADAPESVIFAAPTNCAVIVISRDANGQAPQLAPECGETRSEVRTIQTVRLIGAASLQTWDDFAMLLGSTAATIEVR